LTERICISGNREGLSFKRQSCLYERCGASLCRNTEKGFIVGMFVKKLLEDGESSRSHPAFFPVVENSRLPGNRDGLFLKKQSEDLRLAGRSGSLTSLTDSLTTRFRMNERFVEQSIGRNFTPPSANYGKYF
jgi:hypothetical protein